MNTYTSTLTIIVPSESKDLAARFSRAFDPDTGGEFAFESIRATDRAGNSFAISHSPVTPVTPALAAQSAYLLADAEKLHETTAADYAARWPDLECPTLAETEQFCSVVRCYVDTPLDETLAAEGLILNQGGA
jgi:hypothetical protein